MIVVSCMHALARKVIEQDRRKSIRSTEKWFRTICYSIPIILPFLGKRILAIRKRERDSWFLGRCYLHASMIKCLYHTDSSFHNSGLLSITIHSLRETLSCEKRKFSRNNLGKGLWEGPSNRGSGRSNGGYAEVSKR